MADNEAIYDRYGKETVILRDELERTMPEFHAPAAVQTGGHLIVARAPDGLPGGFLTMPTKHAVCFALPCLICYPAEAE